MKANYFPVDRDDYTSIKSSDIIMNYGYEGYGIYFTMLQKLASTEARHIELSKIKILAYNMRVDEKLLRDIIHQYFDVEGDVFLSKALNSSLGYYDAKYEKNSEGGKKAAANMTPEQRQERARKAAEARYNKSDETINPMLTTKQEMLSDLDVDANNRIEKNRIERKEEKERKENKKISSSSSEINNSNEDYVNYDGIAIQEEIKNHTSIFFNDDNVDYLTSNYNEHKKQIDSKMNLKTYEKILYFLVLLNIIIEANNNNTPIEKGKLNNNYVNDYLMKKQFNLSPSEVEQMFNSVRKDKQMNENLKSIINDVNHQLMKNE